MKSPSILPFLIACIAASTLAQGPGTCGFHLDLLTNLTSTHSAVADLPIAPGTPFGIPAGAAGNPYQAYATPGTVIRLRLSVPAGTLGPSPLGSGGIVSILAAVNASLIVIPPFPGSVAPCQPGQNFIVGVLPVAGTLADGLGFAGPPPLLPPADPGYPNRLEVAVLYPPLLAGSTVTLQAAVSIPGAGLALSNAVSIRSGSNPNETSLISSMTTPCFSPPDEGGASVNTPPGFHFHGLALPTASARANGFIEFGLDQGTTCDFVGSPNSLGCAPTNPEASPRVDVNHGDFNFAVLPAPPNVPDLTVEYAPPFFGTPSRTIVRWKHAVPWFAIPSTAATPSTSMCCELWGGNGAAPAGTIVVVRQEVSGNNTIDINQQTGFGPGDAGDGCGGPTSTCTFTDYWTQFGFPPHLAVPGEMIASNPAFTFVNADMIRHLAIVFSPITLSGVTPGAYSLQVY